jgi:hypothetical protein
MEQVMGRRTVALLAACPILAPTERSGLQAVVNEWPLPHRVDADLMLSSDSPSAPSRSSLPSKIKPAEIVII